MNGSAQKISRSNAGSGVFSSNIRVSWIGSKLIESLGIEPARLDVVHHAMMLRILQNGSDRRLAASDEADCLAVQIVAVARIAETAAAADGPNAAIVAVMRESGKSVDPLLAQNFLRLASSSIFWMALDSASGTPAGQATWRG
jgi:hypothetical protein